MRFLEAVDPTYFTYLAQIHGEQLERQPQHAAIALRTAYHHGLESFFALLFAALQAPHCVFAWLQKYLLSIPEKRGNLDVMSPPEVLV